MAAGTAIVCSDIHGYKGVVKRGEQALLVPPGESRPLAEAILRLLADPGLRERMAQSGLERVAEFGWDRIAARVEAYYGFVIRRLAAQGTLPRDFHAEVPPDPRAGPVA
jgi:phosphatidylinositol alpha-mannosyltransferase